MLSALVILQEKVPSFWQGWHVEPKAKRLTTKLHWCAESLCMIGTAAALLATTLPVEAWQKVFWLHTVSFADTSLRRPLC